MDDLLRRNGLKVHFIGVGGVNMSALAAFLIEKGFTVSGSDKVFNVYCERLSNLGAAIYQWHDAVNVYGADVVVINSAISGDNPELLYALKNKLPIIKRAELLKMIGTLYKTRIGVSGSHGKTTVTALIAHILAEDNASFTAFIGGDDKKFDNFVLDGNDILLCEVCEFKKNINLFLPDIGVTLNVDNDHLDSYEDFSDLKKTFFDFLKRADVAIVNADDKILKKASERYVTFGVATCADYSAANIKIAAKTTFTVNENGKKLMTVKTVLQGLHNVYNVLAAIAVARVMKIKSSVIAAAVESFEGVARRNEFIGFFKGAKCYSDYAHHPKEILSLIKSLNNQKIKGNLYFVFQPHTYSRTKLLFNFFVEVLSQIKNLIILKTYAAREKFEKEYCAASLSSAIKNSVYADRIEEVMAALDKKVGKGDVVYFVGAGDIDPLCRRYMKKR